MGQSTNSAEPFRHCSSSSTVLGKPLSAHFRVDVPAGTLTAVFERDSSGNTRTALTAPGSEAPQVDHVWSARDQVEKLVDHHLRSILVFRRPPSPDWEKWSFGGLHAEWLDDYQEIAGQRVRKVALSRVLSGPGENAPRSVDAGACWISESLMLVMRERVIRADGGVKEWEITKLEAGAPAGDLLATPAGFREIDFPERRPRAAP